MEEIEKQYLIDMSGNFTRTTYTLCLSALNSAGLEVCRMDIRQTEWQRH